MNIQIFIALAVVTVVNSYPAMNSSCGCGKYYRLQIELI